MQDIHNINMTVPLFINQWYNSLKLNNNSIPVNFIRYITHPFIEIMTNNNNNNNDDIPEPPQLMNASPIRISANENQTTFVNNNKYDNYDDPLKFEKDKINLIQLKKLIFDKNVSLQTNNNNIQIMDGDDDYSYKGYLWELLLRLKYKNKKNITQLNNDLIMYKNWFDIGIGIWIRDLGVDFEKHNPFANSSLRFLNAYAYSNVANHQTGSRPNGW